MFKGLLVVVLLLRGGVSVVVGGEVISGVVELVDVVDVVGGGTVVFIRHSPDLKSHS